MAVSLNRPAEGSTNWFSPIDDNWAAIEAAINTLMQPALSGGRLTLTSATPVTTADVIGASTVYFTPYLGNSISLYDGSTWSIYSFSQLSISLSGLTTGKNYDIFAYNDAGTVAIELGPSWTNDTVRYSALVLQDGVLVESGTTSRRYLGTIRTTSSTTTEDSSAKRFVWNMYNRVLRKLFRKDSANAWTWTPGSSGFRAANNSSNNKVEAVNGVADVLVELTVNEMSSTATNSTRGVNIGVDSTTTPSADVVSPAYYSDIRPLTAIFRYYPAEGYHAYYWLEYGDVGVFIQFYGVYYGNGAWQAGLLGSILG